MINFATLEKCTKKLEAALALQEECKVIISRMDFFEKKFKKNQKQIDALISQLERILHPQRIKICK